MKQLGAANDADALFWVAIASSTLGVARLIAGPVWGVLSDRYGRRAMFLRALYCTSFTMLVAGLATQPWHIAAAFLLQGLFSGFTPAAVALTSVIVSDRRLNSSLSVITGAQYVGNTLGPAIGSLLAVALGFRGAIIAGAALPAIAGIYATIAVPKDRVGRAPAAPATPATSATEARTEVTAGAEAGDASTTAGSAAADAGATDGGSIRSLLTPQLIVALTVWFLSLAFGQYVRTVTSIAIEQIVGVGNATGLSGVAFTLTGLGGVIGVMLARRFVRPGLLRTTLIVTCVGVGLGHIALPIAPGVSMFIAAISGIAVLQAAMVPAINTLIAANAPRERRGTAFGIASGVMAVASMVGPVAVAGFAAISLNLGFVVLGASFVALGVMVRFVVREPNLDAAPGTAGAAGTGGAR